MSYYDEETIQDLYDIPGAQIEILKTSDSILGLGMTAFGCTYNDDGFVVIASEANENDGDRMTSRYEIEQVLVTGKGDFAVGILKTMRAHAYGHIEGLIFPENV